MLRHVNVALLPCDEIAGHARSVAEDLRRGAGVDAFVHRGRLPHCTLYLTHYLEADLDRVIETCRELASRQSEVPLTLTELRRKGEWIMIALERPAALAALAETVVTSLGPLHAPGLAPPSWLAPDDAERRANFARFGSPNVGSLYAPHVTIARVEPASRLDGWWAEAATQPLARTRVDGAARALSVALADEDGQFLESLATFELRLASGAE